VIPVNKYGTQSYHRNGFRETQVCTVHANKVHGSVAIVRRTVDTFGRHVEQMISRKMTFKEALNGRDFTIMAKQRLRMDGRSGRVVCGDSRNYPTWGMLAKRIHSPIKNPMMKAVITDLRKIVVSNGQSRYYRDPQGIDHGISGRNETYETKAALGFCD